MNEDGKVNSNFSSEYLDYWKKRVYKTTDGTKVADHQVQEHFIILLEIKSEDKVLDLGCSYGRLCNLLRQNTENVFGLDVDYKVIDEAMKEPYVVTIKGKAENTPFPSNFFDKVIAWAVYDVVDQEKALHEAFRILKPGGKLLFTGKNNNYPSDDHLAFVAERNAKLKKFPNHFTNVYLLLDNLEHFGFDVRHGFAFKRRGDFGENKYVDILSNKPKEFYEYLLIVERLSEKKPCPIEINICDGQSLVAYKIAKDEGFDNIVEFFEANMAKEREQ